MTRRMKRHEKINYYTRLVKSHGVRSVITFLVDTIEELGQSSHQEKNVEVTGR